MNTPQALQLLHAPVTTGLNGDDQIEQSNDNYNAALNGKKVENEGLQYNTMHLKLENIPPFGRNAFVIFT
jgi:hypothetical protein